MAAREDRDEAFTAFVARSRTSLTRAAWFLTGNTDLAAELVQDVYVKTYVAWNRVRTDGALAYARRVLVNTNIDRLRKQHGETYLSDRPDIPDGRDAPAGVDERDEVARWLAVLPAKQRQVVVLRYGQDLSEHDTADTLGLTLSDVKVTASRALAALRAHASQLDLTKEYVR